MFGDNPIIVEVGSISGKIAEYFKDKKVIIYEPSKVNFAELEKNVNGAKLWNKGLDSFCGERLFYDYDTPTSASVHKKDKPVKNRYFIEVVNLEKLFEENEIDKIDLLILSCEGCEEKVLRDVIKFDIRQICINFACNSYNQSIKDSLLESLSEKYYITENDNDYPIYLLIQKCL